MQKDRDQLETMLGTQQDVDQSAQRTSFDDIVRHDELKKVIDEGFVKDFTLVYLWYFISQVQWSLLIPTTWLRHHPLCGVVSVCLPKLIQSFKFESITTEIK